MAGRPLILDLFCGAGGAAVGYHRAGFDVVGVDHAPQPRYPFAHSEQCDAITALRRLLDGGTVSCFRLKDIDAIHASPPCQRYSRAAFAADYKERHADLVQPTRDLLDQILRPWVMENVDGSPLARGSIMLCGLMFGLKLFRHRWFESSFAMLSPSHPSHKGKLIGKDGMCCVVGHGGGVSKRMRSQMRKHGRREGLQGNGSKAEWSASMGIDWMRRNEMSQAIPPAYTAFVGAQLLELVQ